MGMPIAYLLAGNYAAEPNLRMVLEGRSDVGHQFLVGVASTGENSKINGVCPGKQNAVSAEFSRNRRHEGFQGFDLRHERPHEGGSPLLQGKWLLRFSPEAGAGAAQDALDWHADGRTVYKKKHEIKNGPGHPAALPEGSRRLTGLSCIAGRGRLFLRQVGNAVPIA